MATLQFWDTPNYELIRECIHGFLKDPSKCPNVTNNQWQQKTMEEEEEGGEEQDPQSTDKDDDTIPTRNGRELGEIWVSKVGTNF